MIIESMEEHVSFLYKIETRQNKNADESEKFLSKFNIGVQSGK